MWWERDIRVAQDAIAKRQGVIVGLGQERDETSQMRVEAAATSASLHAR